jgi:crotonobetainyl-CoA:carnitine CoA-transferase CaiB-like acyl-CoA transferase
VASPLHLSDTPAAIRRPAPTLGADSDAVLEELGYAADRIAALRTAGVIGGAQREAVG